MRQAAKLSALILSATCFCLAAAAALEPGLAQWVTQTVLSRLDVSASPALFLVLGLIFAGVALGLMVTDDRQAALGLTPPDSAEHAGILSAMVLVAASTGRTTEQDIANIFKIVTGSQLEPDLAALAFRRFQAIEPAHLSTFSVEPSDNPLARRRIMAAALMVGSVANEPTRESTALIESLAFSTGSTPEDVAAARAALQDWANSDSGLQGSPLITLLRSKPLGLRPA